MQEKTKEKEEKKKKKEKTPHNYKTNIPNH
jgi:hypothetical protein